MDIMYAFGLISLLLYGATQGISVLNATQENVPPKVEILSPAESKVLAWNTQVRYSIRVSDLEDGESTYGEINGNEVLLEVEYFPVKGGPQTSEQIEKQKLRPEHEGLALIKKSTCFGCHADKRRIAGPSFSEIAHKYKGTPGVAENLANHIVKGSSGIWGTIEMPAHPDITASQAKQIAEYILEEGANKYRWVYPGLEGAFHIIEKPTDESRGVFILTASYTDESDARSQHSIVLRTGDGN